jgi:hypothetical protein
MSGKNTEKNITNPANIEKLIKILLIHFTKLFLLNKLILNITYVIRIEIIGVRENVKIKPMKIIIKISNLKFLFILKLAVGKIKRKIARVWIKPVRCVPIKSFMTPMSVLSTT